MRSTRVWIGGIVAVETGWSAMGDNKVEGSDIEQDKNKQFDATVVYADVGWAFLST